MTAIQRLDNVTERQRAAIVAPLGAHAAAQNLPWNPQYVALALEDAGGIRGGLMGFIQWDWLYVEILAVEENLRGQGWGRQLMHEAERIAADAGCRGVWLSTFTFQAPAFYEQLGYRRCGEIADYPAGHSRLFYMKHVVLPGQS
jgi:ribosomal protein S18 acetylase RimI-like enzyme